MEDSPNQAWMVLHSKRNLLHLYRIKINRDSNEVISLNYVVENIYPEVQSVEPLMIGLLFFLLSAFGFKNICFSLHNSLFLIDKYTTIIMPRQLNMSTCHLSL